MHTQANIESWMTLPSGHIPLRPPLGVSTRDCYTQLSVRFSFIFGSIRPYKPFSIRSVWYTVYSVLVQDYHNFLDRVALSFKDKDKVRHHNRTDCCISDALRGWMPYLIATAIYSPFSLVCIQTQVASILCLKGRRAISPGQVCVWSDWWSCYASTTVFRGINRFTDLN